MSASLEREIKLRVDSTESARRAVVAAGGRLVHPRRLQSDAVLDDLAGSLKGAGCALRVRTEPGRCFLTYKGPPQPSTMKLREELETPVGDPAILFTLLERLGYRITFRYEKYREEFAVDDVLVAVDETPVGSFLEIEGTDEGITRTASKLGHGPQQYVVDSYRTLFMRRCLEQGVEPGDMLFERSRR